MKRINSAFLIAIILLFLIAAYIQLGPIRTVLRIQNSFKEGDMKSLDKSIDFEAIRESMKIQMHSYINQQDLNELDNLLIESLYLNISYGLIDSMVDDYLQPKTLQSIVNFTESSLDESTEKKNKAEPIDHYHSSDNWVNIILKLRNFCKMEYTSWSEFEISLKHTIKGPVQLAMFSGTRICFKRYGTYWKVNDIIFSESFLRSKLQ